MSSTRHKNQQRRIAKRRAEARAAEPWAVEIDYGGVDPVMVRALLRLLLGEVDQ